MNKLTLYYGVVLAVAKIVWQFWSKYSLEEIIEGEISIRQLEKHYLK